MANHLGFAAAADRVPTQKQEYLFRLTHGLYCSGSHACSEPDMGSDVAGMQTTVRDGDGWCQNGLQRWTVNAATRASATGFAI